MDYDLTLCTSDLQGAGTDGQVRVTLAGSNGASEWSTLTNSSELEGTGNFSRGSADVFKFRALDVGINKTLTLQLVSKLFGF